jgi:peptide deformylase
LAVLDIVLYPDDRLRVKCKSVAAIDDDIRALVDDMVETMYDAPGVGLAAPQVGADVRITVIDCSEPESDRALRVFINPEIIHKEGSLVWEEGCLSIPGVFSNVKRARRVTVRALDRDGEAFEVDADELLAVCLQHEIDHLDGVLFLDHLSRLKARMAHKTYKRSLPEYLERKEEKAKKLAAEADGTASLVKPVAAETAEA